MQAKKDAAKRFKEFNEELKQQKAAAREQERLELEALDKINQEKDRQEQHKKEQAELIFKKRMEVRGNMIEKQIQHLKGSY